MKKKNGLITISIKWNFYFIIWDTYHHGNDRNSEDTDIVLNLVFKFSLANMVPDRSHMEVKIMKSGFILPTLHIPNVTETAYLLQEDSESEDR